MKTFPLVLAAMLAATAFVSSQNAPTAGSSEPSTAPAASPATARVIGDLPDGTLPPQPAKPKLIARAADILETKTHQQGGRQIIVRKLSPVTQPPPRKPAALPVDIASPAIQQRIEDTLEQHPDDELLMVGASVFRTRDGTARSFVGIWPHGRGEPVTFWTSADFSYLSGFCSFTGTDGATRSLLMAWSTVEIGDLSELMEQQAEKYGVPAVPAFASGKAAFAVTSGAADAATLLAIQSLHDLYNNDYQRLKTAFEGRERAARQREAERRANPPESRDIIVNYWPVQSVPKTTEKGDPAR